MRKRAMLVAAVLATAACSRGQDIVITNHSGVSLKDITVSGTGFSENLPAIEPEESQTLTVHGSGESGVGVAFNADGRHLAVPEQGYFESDRDYIVTVTVEPDLKVTVTTGLRQY